MWPQSGQVCIRRTQLKQQSTNFLKKEPSFLLKFFLYPPPLFTRGDGNGKRTLFFFLLLLPWGLNGLNKVLRKAWSPPVGPCLCLGSGVIGFTASSLPSPCGSQETLPSVCDLA